MMAPRQLSDGLSVRALGVRGPSNTRWVLTLIGAAPTDSVRLSLDKEELGIKDVSRPEDGEVGPIQIYLSQETFLTIATTASVRLHVGGVTTRFPPVVRKEMQRIFDKVT